MVVRRGRVAAKRVPTKKVVKAKPAPKARGRQKTNLTDYATKAPTDYHKAMARWIVQEVGYTPTNRKDFLMGVSIATAARPKFMESEFLSEWREKNDIAKRGPKPVTAKKTRKMEAPDDSGDEFEIEDDDDFEDVEDDLEDEDDFEDEEDVEDDDEDEEDDGEDIDYELEDEDDDDEDDDEEEEDPPARPKRRTSAKRAPVKRTASSGSGRSTATKRSPAKSSKAKGSAEDDELLF